jgi:hypothetical protein
MGEALVLTFGRRISLEVAKPKGNAIGTAEPWEIAAERYVGVNPRVLEGEDGERAAGDSLWRDD